MKNTTSPLPPLSPLAGTHDMLIQLANAVINNYLTIALGWIHMHTRTHIYMHMHKHMDVHTHARTSACTHTHIHTRTH